MIENKQDFLNNIVLPIKSYNVGSVFPWALRDTNSNFLLASNSLAHNLGFKSNHELHGQNLKILPFLDEESESALFAFDKQIIETKTIQKHVTLFKHNDSVLVRIVTMIPVLFRGEVIAIDVLGNFVNQYHFDLELFNKVNKIPIYKSVAKIKINETFTNQEIRVLNLLILGKTQQEIATILGVSRTRITQIIASSCERLNIDSASSKVLVDVAISLNYHKSIPPEFFYV